MTFDPDKLWVIEVELSTTDRRHLVGQLNDFINGLGNQQAQRELRDALLAGLNEERKSQLRNQRGELYPWLERLISSPSLVVVTESAASQTASIVANLRLTPSVCELRTFRRVGAEAVHIHQFEPMVGSPGPVPPPLLPPPPPVVKQKRQTHSVSLSDLLNAGLVSSHQRIFGQHGDKTWEGEILDSGQVRTLHDGANHGSLSAAAKHIKKTSEDGWRWWETKGVQGQIVGMWQIREEYERRLP